MSACAAASSLLFFAAPISRAAALRRASAASAFWMAARRRLSISISRFASGGSPRRASPRSKASGLSRIHLMSCICSGLAENRRPVIAPPPQSYPPLAGGRPLVLIGRTNGSFRRICGSAGGGTGGVLGLVGGRLLLHPPHRPDRAFIKCHQRQREGELAEHVGRSEHRRDHEGADDEVAPLLLELLGGDDADAPQQRQNHRQ